MTYSRADKAARRADAPAAFRDASVPAKVLHLDAIQNLVEIQAAHVARRFGLPPHLAAAVADLAWGAPR